MNNSFERFICPTICTDHSSQRKLTRPSLHDPCALQKVWQKNSRMQQRVCCGMDCDLWHAALTAGAGGAAGSCLHNVMQLMQWTWTFRGRKWIYLNVICHRFLSPNIWKKVEIEKISTLWLFFCIFL